MKIQPKLLLIIVVLLASCTDHTAEINQLSADLQGVSDTLGLCKSAREYHQNRIDTLKNSIRDGISRIYNDSIEIDNYLSDHKMAVACIAGGYVSTTVKTDFNTQYPQIVEDLAGWGIILAVGYYIFNYDEVNEVYNKSVEADNRKKQNYAQIASYQQDISDERGQLADVDHLEADSQNRAVALRQQIENLQ